MSSTAVAIQFSTQPYFENTLRKFTQSSSVEKVYIFHDGANLSLLPKCEGMNAGPLNSGAALNLLFKKVKSKYLLLIVEPGQIDFGQFALGRLLHFADETNAGIV